MMPDKFVVCRETSIPTVYSTVKLDKDGVVEDSIFLDANTAYEEYMNVNKKDLMGKSFKQIYPHLKETGIRIINKIADVFYSSCEAEIEYFDPVINRLIKLLITKGENGYLTIYLNFQDHDESLKNELKKANYINSLLLDSLPHPALLVRKDRTVIAANKTAKEQGAIQGGFCWRDWGHALYLKEKDSNRAKSYVPGESEIIRCYFCKGCDSLEIDEMTNVKTWLGDIYWDIYWVPTEEEGVYLHYAIDITQAKKHEEEIRYLSYHDGLTGLHNRLYLEERLKEFENSKSFPISIIIGDINGLKLTNDIFGHEEGDKLLQKAASRFKESCRETDIIARYGGDEFVVVLPNTRERDVRKICKRITAFCKEQCNSSIPSSISIGYASKSSQDENIYDVLKRAEDFMYRHKLLESKSTRSAILQSLETSLHEKDVETKEHAIRLSDLTQKMGAALSFDQNDLDVLHLFARLHDIGKITVDESILKKKDVLTHEERIEIEKHSEAGYRIANSSQDMHVIAEYILSHHERWDGLGYPQGLKKEEIPLFSRMLSIADAYDAMTNDRPYRKAVSSQEALDEIIRCSGTQFDPNLVEIFTQIVLE